jgi:rhodanese-related sulfurtransferase
MTPSIEVRLTSVLHGLRDAIIPAINPGEALAVEQSGLILAQLTMLLKQLPYADRYYRLCRDDARTTAAAIVQECAGGASSQAAADALVAVLAGAGTHDPHADYLALAGGIAALTTDVAQDAEPSCRASINTAVLAFSIRQNTRERVWFKDAGFDPDPGALPDLATLCAANAHS